MIYLDNAATTKPYREAVDAINSINEKEYFNASALYYKGSEAKALIEESRGKIASVLGVNPTEIYFTSGATESDNWALFSGYKNKKGNMVVSAGEHSAVFETALSLKNKGYDVRFAPLNSDGTVNREKFDALVDDRTALVSVIHYSNETGAVNDVFSLAKRCKEKNKKLIFHSDGVQAFCKYKSELKYTDIDLYSISAHKIGGVKGCGALYIRKGINLSPLIFGGGQENSMRSGTENVAAITAFGIASSLYSQEYNTNMIADLKGALIGALREKSADFKLNSCGQNACPAIVSLSFIGINSEILQRLLAGEDVFVGLGSACASKLRSNRVLSEMGLNQKEISGSIRISFSPQNSVEDVKYAAALIADKVNILRSGQIG